MRIHRIDRCSEPARASTRRLFVGWMLACVFANWAPSAGAHTPYQQWVVYRKKHLLIGTCRADLGSYPFGKTLSEVLAMELPESKARVARAPTQERLASLLTTDQLSLILLSHQEAKQLYKGEPPFDDYGPYDLKTVYPFDDYLLVSGNSFPDFHAWLVAQSLAEKYALTEKHAIEKLPVPVHPGLQAHLAGEVVISESLDYRVDEAAHHVHPKD